MEFTDEQITAMIGATECGAKWARELKVGDHFQGASPKANTYFDDARLQRLFVFGAMNVLETLRLCTDGENGIITAVGPRP